MTCVAGATAFGQVKKPATAKPAVKPYTATAGLKSSTDSFSYALGISIANFYKQQGVTNINNQLVIKALNDAKAGKPLMDENQCNSTIMTHMQALRGKKASGAKKAGDAFLTQNKTKAGIVSLASGLQYQVITQGTGPKPTSNDQVKCHYIGSFVDGTEFESSYKNGQPATFTVGGVIRGWTEALQLMPVGSKWKLFIPSELAYGDNDNGPIPAGSTLVFQVELLEIVKQAEQPQQQPQPEKQ